MAGGSGRGVRGQDEGDIMRNSTGVATARAGGSVRSPLGAGSF